MTSQYELSELRTLVNQLGGSCRDEHGHYLKPGPLLNRFEQLGGTKADDLLFDALDYTNQEAPAAVFKEQCTKKCKDAGQFSNTEYNKLCKKRWYQFFKKLPSDCKNGRCDLDTCTKAEKKVFWDRYVDKYKDTAVEEGSLDNTLRELYHGAPGQAGGTPSMKREPLYRDYMKEAESYAKSNKKQIKDHCRKTCDSFRESYKSKCNNKKEEKSITGKRLCKERKEETSKHCKACVESQTSSFKHAHAHARYTKGVNDLEGTLNKNLAFFERAQVKRQQYLDDQYTKANS